MTRGLQLSSFGPATRKGGGAFSCPHTVRGAAIRSESGYRTEMDESLLTIESLRELTDADAEAIASLLVQLSASAEFDRARTEAVIAHEATDLLVARDFGRIVGTATLVTAPSLTGLRGHVEDVVVDEAERGRGIARLLLEHMTQLAQERGLRTLDLTSRPSRESALRLYESVGFRRRETNVLRFSPTAD